MDSDRFDSLVKQLSVLRTRRQGLRVLASGLAAALVGLSPDDSPDFAGPSAAEAKNRRRKRKKNKKKRRQKERPTPLCGAECRKITESCVPVGGPEADCCSAEQCCGCVSAESCADHVKPECAVLFPGRRCCRNTSFACTGNCDCCASLVCQSDGTCGPAACQDLREACEFDPDCCDGGQVGKPRTCQNNPGGACNGLPTRYCCAQANFGADSACTDDCDCCGQVQCLDGFCGGPPV